MKTSRQVVALFALWCMLSVITVSILPGHDHDRARPCDICRSGHLPCLQPTGVIQLTAHLPVVWQRAPEAIEQRSEPAAVIRPPRAPPV